jgi:hypothetical protein
MSSLSATLLMRRVRRAARLARLVVLSMFLPTTWLTVLAERK